MASNKITGGLQLVCGWPTLAKDDDPTETTYCYTNIELQLKIPGMSNNATEIPEQKKTIWTETDQATDKTRCSPNQLNYRK